MRKVLITLLILLLIPANAQAKTIKVTSLMGFSTEHPDKSFSLQTVENEKFHSGWVLPSGAIINGVVNKIEAPKRGKRNAYFELSPTQILYENEQIDIDLSGYTLRVVGYKPAIQVAYTVTRTPASFFLKGVFQGISFAQGAIQAEDGTRIKSGFKKVYDDSFLSLIENGKPLTVDLGDILILKLIKTR